MPLRLRLGYSRQASFHSAFKIKIKVMVCFLERFVSSDPTVARKDNDMARDGEMVRSTFRWGEGLRNGTNCMESDSVSFLHSSLSQSAFKLQSFP